LKKFVLEKSFRKAVFAGFYRKIPVFTTDMDFIKKMWNFANPDSFATVAKPSKCFLCQGPHFIYLCTKFLSFRGRAHK